MGLLEKEIIRSLKMPVCVIIYSWGRKTVRINKSSIIQVQIFGKIDTERTLNRGDFSHTINDPYENSRGNLLNL